MLTIYKNKKDIPTDKEYVELNDIFFNMNTSSLLDDRAKDIIRDIDASELISRYKILSCFNGVPDDYADLTATGRKENNMKTWYLATYKKTDGN